jgi:uncharacterized protein (TIGR02118 family)
MSVDPGTGLRSGACKWVVPRFVIDKRILPKALSQPRDVSPDRVENRETKTVLIRSGLIQNFDHIDVGTFSRHWREVHGPLAAKVPNLRGYVQNHIVARGDTPASDLHRIDGISQLWFDNVDAMTAGMASPENDACIADIAGFLSRVTLAIQDPGAWVVTKGPPATGAKIMAVYSGDATAFQRVEREIANAFRAGPVVPTSYRVNRIVTGQFIVDPSIARSDAPLRAILEAYFTDNEARSRFLATNPLAAPGRLSPATVLAVTPHTFLSPPA